MILTPRVCCGAYPCAPLLSHIHLHLHLLLLPGGRHLYCVVYRVYSDSDSNSSTSRLYITLIYYSYISLYTSPHPEIHPIHPTYSTTLLHPSSTCYYSYITLIYYSCISLLYITLLYCSYVLLLYITLIYYSYILLLHITLILLLYTNLILLFYITLIYYRVDIWRNQRSCKILVSRVNFQKTAHTALQFTQS